MTQRSSIIRFHELRIESKRYATYTQPWTDNRTPITELGCLECRENGMPKVILSWDKISVFSILTAMAAHERDFHRSEITALRAVV